MSDNQNNDDDQGKRRSAGDSDGEKPWWAEMVKEGLGTLFTTEETVRNALKDKKLPKELINPFVENLSKKKDDFYRLLAKEVGARFSKLDFRREAVKFLETHDVKMEAKFSFIPKGNALAEVEKDSEDE